MGALEIVRETGPGTAQISQSAFAGTIAGVNGELETIKRARKDVESRVVAAESEKYNLAIRELVDRKKGTREAAVQTLKGATARLTQAQIRRLESLASGVGEPWREFLHRGPHCAYYEITPSGSPASKVLLELPQAKVSVHAWAAEKQQVAAGSRTVREDDPGWV